MALSWKSMGSNYTFLKFHLAKWSSEKSGALT